MADSVPDPFCPELPDARPDEFFTAEQIRRLRQLMERFRAACDAGEVMDEGERAELEALVDAELRGVGQRAAKWADELGF